MESVPYGLKPLFIELLRTFRNLLCCQTIQKTAPMVAKFPLQAVCEISRYLIKLSPNFVVRELQWLYLHCHPSFIVYLPTYWFRMRACCRCMAPCRQPTRSSFLGSHPEDSGEESRYGTNLAGYWNVRYMQLLLKSVGTGTYLSARMQTNPNSQIADSNSLDADPYLVQ